MGKKFVCVISKNNKAQYLKTHCTDHLNRAQTAEGQV